MHIFQLKMDLNYDRCLRERHNFTAKLERCFYHAMQFSYQSYKNADN